MRKYLQNALHVFADFVVFALKNGTRSRPDPLAKWGLSSKLQRFVTKVVCFIVAGLFTVY